jgi:hypothetical protein
MSTRYSQVRIAMDLFNEAPRFAPAGHDGDRFEMFISFEGDLPVPVPGFTSAPRVIITPVRKFARDGAAGFNLMTPICAARDVTARGFRLAASNQDPDFGGLMAFNWVAMEESPGGANPVPKLATGVLPPLHYAPFRESLQGHRSFQDHQFAGSGMFDSSVASVQLTSSDASVQQHSVPAVGIVYDPQDETSHKEMTAHNVDVAGGGCAFNWATFSQAAFLEPASNGDAPEPSVATGDVAEAWFEPGGHTGDWHTWEVAFKARFMEAPVVLLTATSASDIPQRLNVATVAVAQVVTASGFRLAARSCDTRAGLSGFNWIAIGRAN